MIDDILHYNTHIEPEAGKILISEPMLQDENFQKTVILLCHHDNKESAGFVLNRLANQPLGYYIQDLNNVYFPLYVGGPVETNTIHFIHSVPELVGGTLVADNIYWSGDMEQVVECIKLGKVTPDNCKFFLGYSGWGEGQLLAELDMKSWLVTHSSNAFVFDFNDDRLWTKAIESLGPKFKNLLFVPANPALN
jgi:putative transcriptional regulator